MATFQDLVHALSHDPHVRGRQFERVCQWYLLNDPIQQSQFRRAWLWRDWPSRWGPDAGIDLVAETVRGDLWAIQAKAYAPSSPVKKDDIGTFLSESARAEFSARMLIATTNHVSLNAKRTIAAQEKPVHVILASELAKTEYWPADPDSLEPPEPKPKSPLPHQLVAWHDVLRGFRDAERGQLLMACGTGKTLVSLWVWESLKPAKAMVVTPSLSLLAQTLREWQANKREEFDWLAVCSDESVADSDLAIRSTAELPFATTTDERLIASWLASTDGAPQVIFSTYQSAERVGEALTACGRTLDLLVADEAHRCAGRASGGFAAVLDNERVSSARRLFMTATPRYLTPRLRQTAEGAGVDVVSMDDEVVFGTVFHRLSFGKAIADNLLNDYQAVIIGVDDEDFREMAKTATLVESPAGAVTDARTLASQAALLKGIAKYDLRRCVTFHSLVSRAREFADSLSEVCSMLPSEDRPTDRLWADHVSGGMSSGRRDVLLDRLRSLEGCDRGLLANARCLAEGVDVPSLDGVAFIDPRSSQTDIVQAVGRVIRRTDDGKLGTVVLPVFVSADSDPSEAVEDSVFDPVWKVLNALRAHDETLAEELDGLRLALGRFGTCGHPHKVVVDMPARVGEAFVRAFDVRLVERTSPAWPFWYGLLESFVQREGHALVPQKHCESGLMLGSWVTHQRVAWTKGELAAERATQLEDLPGWSWNPAEDRWERYFAALLQYVLREGHARVPTVGSTECGLDLGAWVSHVRTNWAMGSLSAAKSARLEALPGWTWDPYDDEWERRFAILLQFVEREGHAVVPRHHIEAGLRLESWVRNQRQSHLKGRLTIQRIARLEALPGWSWDGIEGKWDRNFLALRAFVQREGHARVPAKHIEAGIRLGLWVANRRNDHHLRRLDPARVALLESQPGWTWTALDEKWERMFEALVAFASREGHTRVKQDHREDDLALGTWVGRQRAQHDRHALSPDRVARLEALPGWSWNPTEDYWSRCFVALLDYISREGHAAVPQDHCEDGLRLGNWVSVQRRKHSQGTLDPERTAQLEALPGWYWHLLDASCNKFLASLRGFASREGHALVPYKHLEDGLPLGRWVGAQRQCFARGGLNAARIAQLEALPKWAWSVVDASWERHFAALLAFAEREGHASVPNRSIEGGLALGQWVGTLRQQYSEGHLGPDHVAQLEGLPGWSWDAKASQWESRLSLLCRFIEREGHARVPAGHTEEGVPLGTWVSKRRDEYARGCLSPSRIAQLEALPGWSWDPLGDDWEAKYAVLLHFVEREGHARVPLRHVEDGIRIGAWAGDQRRNYERRALDPDKAARLEALPEWSWNPFDDRWKAAYTILVDYSQREGHAAVPISHVEQGFRLGNWVSAQRRARRTGRLSPERQRLLESVRGWVWERQSPRNEGRAPSSGVPA